MRFTIITATFNCEHQIERTVRSVVAQKHSDIQHLIIDGGSSDGTLDVIRRCHSPFIEVVSETDKGIYDAFNKGVGLAQGDVIAFLNADDYYLDGALETVRQVFDANPKIAVVHGNVRVQKGNQPVTIRAPRGIFAFHGARVLHPAFFCRRSVFDAIGQFNTQYKILADLDFMFRAHKQFAFHHIERCLTHFELGGISTRHRFQVANEVRGIARSHGIGAAHTSIVWLIECGTKLLGMATHSIDRRRRTA